MGGRKLKSKIQGEIWEKGGVRRSQMSCPHAFPSFAPNLAPNLTHTPFFLYSSPASICVQMATRKADAGKTISL